MRAAIGDHLSPLVPAQAGIQGGKLAAPAVFALDSRFRGNERSLYRRMSAMIYAAKSSATLTSSSRGSNASRQRDSGTLRVIKRASQSLSALASAAAAAA